MDDNDTQKPAARMPEEYRVLHEVAQALQAPGETEDRLRHVLEIITQFDELRVERKAGIFLADETRRVLNLYITIGSFTKEFLDREQEVPFGDCLCGRAAATGNLLMSDSCFTDPRHERTFTDMTAHGHYIIPLKSRDKMVGVMFLYTCTRPRWYLHSQEVLLSIGGLMAGAIERSRSEEELRASHQKLEQEVARRLRVEQALVHYQDHLEEEVRARTEQLRNLSHRLQTIREEEKSRLARDVHDGLGQALTALKLDLAWLERRLDADPATLRKKMTDMHGLIEDTIRQVQKISSELRPPILDILGICDAIRWQTREFSKRAGIPCDLSVEPKNFDLDPDRAIALFRIYQETLTNVVRHSGASRVEARLARKPKEVELVVRDDGCGIDPAKMNHPESLGLIGMRERVATWGGEVRIEGQPGRGTTVTVVLPVEET